MVLNPDLVLVLGFRVIEKARNRRLERASAPALLVPNFHCGDVSISPGASQGELEFERNACGLCWQLYESYALLKIKFHRHL